MSDGRAALIVWLLCGLAGSIIADASYVRQRGEHWPATLTAAMILTGPLILIGVTATQATDPAHEGYKPKVQP